MDKGIKYDKMVNSPLNDQLGLFNNYFEIFQSVRKRIRDLGAGRIVDLACGTGNLCGELSEEIKVIGIDRDEEMLERARNKFPMGEFKRGNILDSCIEKESVDVVATSFVLHALTDQEQEIALENMLGYLKSEGKMIIVDYMFRDQKERFDTRKKLMDKGERGLWEFVEKKNFIDVAKFSEKIGKMGYCIRCEHMNDFSWVVEVEKNKPKA